MFMTSQHHQIDVQPVRFLHYGFDDWALHQQSRGFDILFLNTFSEMLKKIMFIAELGSGLSASRLTIDIERRLV
jgi:hypothetical protein